MNDDIKHESVAERSGYEHEDWVPQSVIYFLLTLGVATVICLVGLRGLYSFLDRRAQADQPPLSPLVTNVPADTRHIAPGYPQTAFPSPRLERVEGEELDRDLINEQKNLYSYGWVDEKSGTMHIPIERAMQLIAQRGLPVRAQGASSEVASAKPGTSQKDKKK